MLLSDMLFRQLLAWQAIGKGHFDASAILFTASMYLCFACEMLELSEDRFRFWQVLCP